MNFTDRQLPWSADGVPCLVRCGKYGVVASLTEAELSAAVGVFLKYKLVNFALK